MSPFEFQGLGCDRHPKSTELSCQFLGENMKVSTATLGYPRIGKNHEVKKALEAFWSGKIDEDLLLKTVEEVEAINWKTQLEEGSRSHWYRGCHSLRPCIRLDSKFGINSQKISTVFRIRKILCDGARKRRNFGTRND